MSKRGGMSLHQFIMREAASTGQFKKEVLVKRKTLIDEELVRLRVALLQIANIEKGWNRPHRLDTARGMLDDCVTIAKSALDRSSAEPAEGVGPGTNQTTSDLEAELARQTEERLP